MAEAPRPTPDTLRDLAEARDRLIIGINNQFVLGTLMRWQREGVFLTREIRGAVYEFRRDGNMNMFRDGQSFTTQPPENLTQGVVPMDTPFGVVRFRPK